MWNIDAKLSEADWPKRTDDRLASFKWDESKHPRNEKGRFAYVQSGEQTESAKDAPAFEEYEDAWAGGVADFGDPEAALAIQTHPEYYEYKEQLVTHLKETYGDTITVYRAVGEEAYEGMAAGEDAPAVGVTTDPEVAKNWVNFAHTALSGAELRILKTIIKPDIAIMKGKDEESEIVVDGNWISFGDWEELGRATAKGGFVAKEPTSGDVEKQIADITGQKSYAHYGVRVDNNPSLEVGKPAPASSDWSDDDHPVPLKGTAAVDVSDWKRVINYSGSDLVLLGSAEAHPGTDRSERVMPDAVVLAKWKMGEGFWVAKKFDPNQPRDAKGRFTDLGLHDGMVTVLHGTTRQNAEAIMAGGFKPGNPAAVAAQIEKEYNLPKDSILNHVAFQFAKGRTDLDEVHFTTNEEVADQYSVPEVMQDALTSAHMLLHPIDEDQPYTKELYAEKQAWMKNEARRLMEPALLAVTFPYEVAGQHAFGKTMTLEEFNQLTDRFDVEDSIFNNIRIPISALTKAKISIRKWDESQHPRDKGGKFRGKSTYQPDHDAPKEGEWDWTGVDRESIGGPGPKWRQEHHALVVKALQSWIGDPGSFRLHSQDALEGAPQPGSGSGKHMRAQAEALLWEIENNSIPTPVDLYRGSGPQGDLPGTAYSWSEDRKVAKVFATRYGGMIETLPAGAKGLRLRDYAGDSEQHWIVRAGNTVVKKWDESQHPRNPAGSGDKSGEFTGSVMLYRGDSENISPALSYSDPNALFGAGIYLTDSKRIAGDYKSKGRNEGEVFRYGGGAKGTKEEAIKAYIRTKARYIDADGNQLQFPKALHGYSGKGSPEWNKKVKEDESRMAHAKKEWDAEKKDIEVRKLADHNIVFQKKGQTGHLSEYAVPKAWIDKTLNAEEPISNDVLSALHGVIRSVNPGLAREIYAKGNTKDDMGFLPSFREVYREAAGDSMIMSGLDTEEGQTEFRKALKELGYKGIAYAGGITMGGAQHKAYVFWDEQGLKKVRKKRQGSFQWDASKHPRNPAGSSEGGEFTETLHGPKDALESLLNKEKNITIDRNDVRKFIELAGEQLEDPDLTDLQVDGMQIFGGNGLGIPREEMPQIPKEHRKGFLEYAKKRGITMEEDAVDPLSLKPTQTKISARNVADKFRKYDKGGREFPPILVAQNGRILDGHHHWGMMAVFALDFPKAKVPVYRFKSSTKEMLSVMKAYMKIHGLKRESLSGVKQAWDEAKKADPQSGRYVTPFVSFDKQGDDQLRMIASLNSSRLATWGFTAEAEVRGIARYRTTAVLDGRTSEFCRFIDGKIFDVPDARAKVIEALNVQNPDDLRTVQPWPSQSKSAMEEYRQMSSAELVTRGLHIPPYHPYCRTLLRPVESSTGDLAQDAVVATLPKDVETFQPVTMSDLAELGVEANPEQLDLWNTHVGMSPVELLSKLSGMSPQDVMTKFGEKSIQFQEMAEIAFKAKGVVSGVEFKLGATLDPFTGTYYLNYADLLTGTPHAEVGFLKRMFRELIDIGEASPTAKALAVGVAGNAAYYAKLGFLPDDIEWDYIRHTALDTMETSLKPMIDSLKPIDQALVKNLLQDQSVDALSALVDLPFVYQGRTIGEWILGDIGGTWALDLLDDAVVAHAKGYLL